MAADFDKIAFFQRLRHIREKYAGSRGKAFLSKELGVSPSTYNYYEKDRLAPADLLWKICKITGTDIRWLLDGDALKTDNPPVDNPIPDSLLTKITEICRTDPQTLPALNAFIDLLLEKSGNQTPKSPSTKPHSRRPWIPILGRTAAGIVHFWPEKEKSLPGITELAELIQSHQNQRHHDRQPRDVSTDALTAPSAELVNNAIKFVHLFDPPNNDVAEFIESDTICRQYPDALALRVDGDSMAPRILDGDIVILSPSAATREGMTAVVQLKNQIGATCKIIRYDNNNIHLIPANEHYDIKIYPRDQVAWVMPVLWRVRL